MDRPIASKRSEQDFTAGYILILAALASLTAATHHPVIKARETDEFLPRFHKASSDRLMLIDGRPQVTAQTIVFVARMIWHNGMTGNVAAFFCVRDLAGDRVWGRVNRQSRPGSAAAATSRCSPIGRIVSGYRY